MGSHPKFAGFHQLWAGIFTKPFLNSMSEVMEEAFQMGLVDISPPLPQGQFTRPPRPRVWSPQAHNRAKAGGTRDRPARPSPAPDPTSPRMRRPGGRGPQGDGSAHSRPHGSQMAMWQGGRSEVDPIWAPPQCQTSRSGQGWPQKAMGGDRGSREGSRPRGQAGRGMRW